MKEVIKKQFGKILIKIRNINVILMFLALVFVLEPVFRDKLTFAFTFFNESSVNNEQAVGQKIAVTQSVKLPAQEKTRAPEPSTLLLILAGLSSALVRFAQKSFGRFKRLLDVCLSILGLTITFPILVFAGIMIKLNSKGPVVYQQNRVGKKGKIFKIYKLRSMRTDAEKGIGAVWAKRNDPRITTVGKILRKTRIDEIPQLLNVLKGEMSIVGPRPERPEMVRDFKNLICDYEKRLLVKPGITGLSQIYNRYDETIADVRRKVKYDLLYVKKMCLWVEMRILARTFVVALTGKGAN